jgi:hypothetical protein
MYTLKNDSLTVTILDPVADKDRLGTRYCTAGFIFEVTDAARGPLMSGPTYPDSYNLFDGQGIPDAFQPHLLLEQDSGGSPAKVLGIGIGLVDQKANVILERCAWEVTKGEGSLTFRTTQAAGLYRFTLERTVTLRGRTIRSSTVLTNGNARHVPFQWYPHPFYPLYPSGECCRFSVPVTIADNAGYEILENGFFHMKHLPWKKEQNENHFLLVQHAADRPLSFVQKHPVTGLVAASTDYVPQRMPIWGNTRTFSFEPMYERCLSENSAACWSMTYDF